MALGWPSTKTSPYRKAAEQRFGPAEASLGLFYLEGKGVPKDSKLAFEWLNKAAVQEVPTALTAVCYLYLMGQGVKQDDAGAGR